MAYIESRKRKNGATVYLVRWTDKTTGLAQNQKCEERKDADFLLSVLKAHDQDTEKALASALDYYGGIYTVTKMIEDHISMLTSADGYTIRRYKGNARNHIQDSLGLLDASVVGYRDIATWIQGMQSKGLSAKTVANVHGLISAAFNTMVREKKRPDNPCKGVALPKDSSTEEAMTFITIAEWERLRGFLNAPYRDLFHFLALTGLRFSEATALFGRDFKSDGERTVLKIVRAWKRDENNVLYLGAPKSKRSRRTVLVDTDLYRLIAPLIDSSRGTKKHVFLNRDGNHMDHRAAWHAWDRAVMKAQAAGLARRPRIHDLRHSNASWLLQAGLSIYQLQRHLGHESITTTVDKYSHLLPEALTDTAAAMGKAFASASPVPRVAATRADRRSDAES